MKLSLATMTPRRPPLLSSEEEAGARRFRTLYHDALLRGDVFHDPPDEPATLRDVHVPTPSKIRSRLQPQAIARPS